MIDNCLFWGLLAYAAGMTLLSGAVLWQTVSNAEGLREIRRGVDEEAEGVKNLGLIIAVFFCLQMLFNIGFWLHQGVVTLWVARVLWGAVCIVAATMWVVTEEDG